MLTELRIHLAVLTEQAHETIHRLRLRHCYAYRVEWVHVMRSYREECKRNDALARARTYGA